MELKDIIIAIIVGAIVIWFGFSVIKDFAGHSNIDDGRPDANMGDYSGY